MTAASPSNGSTGSIANEKPLTAITRDEFMARDFNPRHLNLIVQEGIILGAGAAAILLQVAEAGVGQGVNQYSNFAYRVVDRLRTTMTFVYCMSYGTPEEKQTIVDLVTKIHGSVSGTLEEGRNKGKQYSALDPELQMWVAATLYASGLDIYQRVFGRIEDEQLLEKIYREYSILACALQVPPDMWPATRKDFWVYWERRIEELDVTNHAKSVGDDLLYLRKAPLYLRIFMPAVRVVTAELLPSKLRREYGVKHHPKTYKFYELMVKATYRPLPLVVRSLPVRFYMYDMRKRLKQQQKIFEKA